MKTLEFKTLDDLFECYDKRDLVAIDTLRQAIFYIKHGVQPEFVYEKEGDPGRATFWFLKAKTRYVFAKWKQES